MRIGGYPVWIVVTCAMIVLARTPFFKPFAIKSQSENAPYIAGIFFLVSLWILIDALATQYLPL